MAKCTSHTHAALIVSSAALLSACSSGDPVYSSFGTEAGSLLNSGTFGNATMNNTQIMSGEKQYAYDLSARFANEVLTTVNFAFGSAQLDAGAHDTLREQAAWIRQFPEVRFRVGNAYLRDSAYHCNFAGDDCWYIKTHPKIDTISVTDGYITGG